MTKHYCDRCGKEEEDLKEITVDAGYFIYYGRKKTYSVCKKCRKEIVSFIRNPEEAEKMEENEEVIKSTFEKRM